MSIRKFLLRFTPRKEFITSRLTDMTQADLHLAILDAMRRYGWSYAVAVEYVTDQYEDCKDDLETAKERG
jgi:hypothetical protein